MDSFGKLAGYSAAAVGGLVGTRFLSDIIARGIESRHGLLGALLGTWATATWVGTRRPPGPHVQAALIGSGMALAEEILSYALPLAGLGPKDGICPPRKPSWTYSTPGLFRPSREGCEPNFWRGRWVACRKPDGTIERRWCHDAKNGPDCCPPGTRYEGMDDWPEPARKIGAALGAARRGSATMAQLGEALEIARRHRMPATAAEISGHIRSCRQRPV
jgi:hypothetical protein